MKALSLACTKLIAAFLVCGYDQASSQTLQDFDNMPGDSAGTAYSVAQCDFDSISPPPKVMFGGPKGAGNFLRLAAKLVPTNNSIAFDRTNPGLFGEIIAEFDFRMTPGTGRADGMGFALLNTAYYDNRDSTCPGDPLYAAEEPNFKGSLGIGFDIHKAADPRIKDNTNNDISIHFNGITFGSFAVDSLNLAEGQWLHARIIMRPGRVFSDVSVTLAPWEQGQLGVPHTVIDKFRIPAFEPYEGRVFFGARSGGESADHDLDNVNVRFSGKPDPAVYGEWSDTLHAEIIPIHLHLLPTGKVLYWQNGGDGVILRDQIRLWEPATEIISTPALPDYDVFCAGHSFLADGKLFVAGGHDMEDHRGPRNASVYDPFADTWTPLPLMNAGRWYPTNTTLGNGDVLVLSGDIEEGRLNLVPQVWQTASGTWRDLIGAENLEPQFYDLYPRMFLIPDGRVFRVDLTEDENGKTWFLDVNGAGAWSEGPPSNFGRSRSYGSAVMYGSGKILSVGGSVFPPTNTAEIIDLNETKPRWCAVAPMLYARRYLNAVLLPGGEVLAVGGTRSPGFNGATDAVYVAEMWDPEEETWTMMAGMQAARIYHSTAILLPDGRVLAGGGGRPGPDDGEEQRNFEIYSPPYLFKGTRPVIEAAPDSVGYGQTFFVKTSEAADVANVNWIRLPSVTHAFDQNQRFNRLSFSRAADGLNVTAIADANISPPGHYMLFILNGNGVPSIAHIIQVVYDTSSNAVADNGIELPMMFELRQNFPNPFNPMTTIFFELPKAEFVTLKVYNVTGEEVARLVSKKMPAGRFNAQFDASTLASGVYLYRLQTETFTQSKKMLLVR